MKLIPKSEVSRSQAIQKRQELDEGMKLAKRVDDLRALQATEEKSLQDFRNTFIAEVKRETFSALAERDGILSEVRMLRAEKQRDMKELTERSLELDEISKSLDEREKSIEQKLSDISGKEKMIDEIRQKLLEERKIADIRREEAEKLQISAFENEKRAKSVLIEANNVKEQAESEAEMIKQELASREAVLARNEANLAKKELQNTEDRAQIERDRIRIKDRYAMLERDKKRI
jgi:hypothetical protein